jgi:hypothetical protein
MAASRAVSTPELVASHEIVYSDDRALIASLGVFSPSEARAAYP